MGGTYHRAAGYDLVAAAISSAELEVTRGLYLDANNWFWSVNFGCKSIYAELDDILGSLSLREILNVHCDGKNGHAGG